VAAELPIGAVLRPYQFVVVVVPGRATQIGVGGGHRRCPTGRVGLRDGTDHVLVEPVPVRGGVAGRGPVHRVAGGRVGRRVHGDRRGAGADQRIDGVDRRSGLGGDFLDAVAVVAGQPGGHVGAVG